MTIQPSGHSHSFDTGIAEQVGVNAAIVLNHIIYWLKHNSINKNNIIDGHVWMYETMAKMATYFAYLNERQIRYAIKALVESGILIEANYNKNKFDRTSWYALSDESILGFSKKVNSATKLSHHKTNYTNGSDNFVGSHIEEKNDIEEMHKKNVNVTEQHSEYRSFDAQEPIVPFDPGTFILPNGQNLSLKMQRSINKYSYEDMKKLRSNVFYFQEQVAKGKKFDNPEAYLQKCINMNYAKSESNVLPNELYAKWAKENYKLHRLEILKTGVRFKKSDNEPPFTVKFSLPYDSFVASLDQYIEKNKD